MSVDRVEVARIADLARLSHDEPEVARLTDELNRILEHADRLREADRSQGVPGGEASVEPGGTRAPEAEEPDALLAGPATFAPRFEQGFFVVPPPPGVTHDDDVGGTTDDGA